MPNIKYDPDINIIDNISTWHQRNQNTIMAFLFVV